MKLRGSFRREWNRGGRSAGLWFVRQGGGEKRGELVGAVDVGQHFSIGVDQPVGGIFGDLEEPGLPGIIALAEDALGPGHAGGGEELFPGFLGVVDAEADHGEAGILAVGGVDLLKVGEVAMAIGAPDAPDVEQDHPAFELRE